MAVLAASLGSSLHPTSGQPWSQPTFSTGDTCIAPVEPPPARSPAEAEHRSDVDDVLRHFWDELGGYGIPALEEEAILKAGWRANPSPPASKPSTYGEVTQLGVRQLGRALGLDDLCIGDKVFMDLGSGIGKFVAQAYLEWPAVARAVGVELSGTRSARARAAWGEAEASGEAPALRGAALALAGGNGSCSPSAAAAAAAESGRHQAGLGVSFIEGDLLAADVAHATHIYVASLCFGEDMLRRLAAKLDQEAVKLAAIASLRRFPDGLQKFDQVTSMETHMSWTRASGGGATTYLYRRRKEF